MLKIDEMSTKGIIAVCTGILLGFMVLLFSINKAYEHSVRDFRRDAIISIMHIEMNEVTVELNNSIAQSYIFVEANFPESKAAADRFIALQKELILQTERDFQEFERIKHLIYTLEDKGGLQFRLRRDIRQRLDKLYVNLTTNRQALIDDIDLVLDQMWQLAQ